MSYLGTTSPSPHRTKILPFSLVGDGVTTEFNLGYLIPSKGCLAVSIQGVYQHQDTFLIGSIGTSVVFSEAPPLGRAIDIKLFVGVDKLRVPDEGTVKAINLESEFLRKVLKGNKNRLINGDFDWWQRGTVLAAGTGVKYLADRWTVESIGTTIAASQQPFIVGQSEVPHNPRFFHRCVVASVAGAPNYACLDQRIEMLSDHANKTFAFSFWAKADAARTIAVNLSQVFGTGGSGQIDGLSNQKFTLTTSWKKYTAILNSPSIAGKTIGNLGNDCLSVNIYMDSSANIDPITGNLGRQSGTFDFAQCQFEEGDVATEFEYRPLAQELAMCQRYYEVGSWFQTNYGSSSSVTQIRYAVTKRAVPSIVASNWSYFNSSGGTISLANNTSFNGNVTVTATGNVNWSFNWTADAEF